MKRRPLFWRIYPSYLVILLLSLVTVSWLAVDRMGDFYFREKVSDLEVRARLISRSVSALLKADERDDLGALCDHLASDTGTRITVVLPEGKVLCDTRETASRMDDHSDRPEIRQALAGGTGTSLRYSYTLKTGFLYVAVPAEGESGPVVVRTSVPVSSLERALYQARTGIVLGALSAMLAASLFSLYAVRRITRPLKEMQDGLERFAAGDLHVRLPTPKTAEFARLAEEMNRMARLLDERIRAVEERRNQLDSVLSSMVEGVVALDREGRIITLNNAACNLLGTDPATVTGRSIQEAIRNPRLQEFLRRSSEASGALEEEITLQQDGGQHLHLQLHGSRLQDSHGSRMGVLLVMNDLTRLRALERVRRDFVANASHEIRTPVTAIKGFVETLLEGALQDPEHSKRFLGIIARHADRLSALVDDLLSLSSIERQAERGDIALESGELCPAVEEAVEACQAEADARGVLMVTRCPTGPLRLPLNRTLLVQALVNLICNAVKYSGEGQEVLVTCREKESSVELEVTDSGCGIASRHLPRIFERFYRVDSSRSREGGGTGLGLAIVKHVAQAHHGEVKVASTPGKGSTFTLSLKKGGPMDDADSR